jgi:hypothetical protein
MQIAVCFGVFDAESRTLPEAVRDISRRTKDSPVSQAAAS